MSQRHGRTRYLARPSSFPCSRNIFLKTASPRPPSFEEQGKLGEVFVLADDCFAQSPQKSGRMTAQILSVDGACSGRKAACAAVASRGGRIIAQFSGFVPHVQGYALAAEIAAVGIAARLLDRLGNEADSIVIEVDNPDVPRVIRDGYRPKQFHRIPLEVLRTAFAFDRARAPIYRVLPRNSTPGLRRADRLARAHLWRRRRMAHPKQQR